MARAYKRDPDGLAETLSEYSPVGMRVHVPHFGHGVIVRQAHGREWFEHRTLPSAQFRISLENPVPFEDYARSTGASDEKMNRKELVEYFGGTEEAETMLLWLGAERVERGVSPRDILYASLAGQDCIEGGRVVCVTVRWTDVEVDPIMVGQLVEFTEPGSHRHTANISLWYGRVVGIKKNMTVEGRTKDVVLLELFEPMTQEGLPESIVPEAIKKGFYSAKTWALGYRLYETWQSESPETLPEASLADSKTEYILKEPIDLSEVEKFCSRFEGESEECLREALIMFVVPIEVSSRFGGRFHPLRASEENAQGWNEGWEWEQEQDIFEIRD